MARDRYGDIDTGRWISEREQYHREREKAMSKNYCPPEKYFHVTDSKVESKSYCSPFMLRHVGKIGVGFFILGVALAVVASIATGGVLPLILGSLSAVSFISSIYFFKKADDRDNAASINALAKSYDQPGAR